MIADARLVHEDRDDPNVVSHDELALARAVALQMHRAVALGRGARLDLDASIQRHGVRLRVVATTTGGLRRRRGRALPLLGREVVDEHRDALVFEQRAIFGRVSPRRHDDLLVRGAVREVHEGQVRRAVGERRQVAEHRRPQQLHDLVRERRPELDAARAVLRVVALALHELAELVGGVARDGDADAEGGYPCGALAVHAWFLTACVSPTKL